MDQRPSLQTLLESITDNVYFQPPTDEKMEYPCIRYELDTEITKYADNVPYNIHERYKVTIIDRNPDSAIPGKVRSLPMSSFDRFYRAAGLNHFVYNLFHEGALPA